jgi:hypothetical protein
MKRSQAWLARALLCGWLVSTAIVLGQEAKKPEVPAKPTISYELRAKILKAQLDGERLQREYQACQSRNWQGDLIAVNQRMQAAINEAFDAAKIKKDEYDLNLETFEFVKKPSSPKVEERK